MGKEQGQGVPSNLKIQGKGWDFFFLFVHEAKPFLEGLQSNFGSMQNSFLATEKCLLNR